MRILWSFLALALLASPAAAQINNPGGVTQAQLDAVSAAVSTKCDPTAAIPPMEIVGGSAGSGIDCRLANAVQPRITRSVGFTTIADGTAAVSWPTMGATPLVIVQENINSSATNIPKCFPVTGTITATGVTVKCYITQTLLGLGLVPFITATAGVVGQVVALPAS